MSLTSGCFCTEKEHWCFVVVEDADVHCDLGGGWEKDNKYQDPPLTTIQKISYQVLQNYHPSQVLESFRQPFSTIWWWVSLLLYSQFDLTVCCRPHHCYIITEYICSVARYNMQVSSWLCWLHLCYVDEPRKWRAADPSHEYPTRFQPIRLSQWSRFENFSYCLSNWVPYNISIINTCFLAKYKFMRSKYICLT